MKNLITCLVVCVLSGTALADTWTVDDDGKADFDNIQAAVDAEEPRGGEREIMPCDLGRVAGNRGVMSGTLWPAGLVYYDFDASISQLNRDRTRAAMDLLEAEASMVFIPRTNEPNYIHIIEGGGNWSWVGMLGGSQDLSMYNWDWQFIICHELIHALGRLHQQSRSDRDNYITVNWECIDTKYADNYNMCKQCPNYGEYDFESVMHYSQWGFNNGCPTMTCLPGYEEYQDVMGQRDYLSDGDIETLQFMYGSGPSIITVPGDFTTIQAAIDAAGDGDEIIVMPGTYTGTGDQVVDMLGKAVWLHSSGGQEVTIIDGEDTRRGILCDSSETNKTIIEGFTITNCGGGGSVNGLYNGSSSPTLTNCTFTGNSGWNNGGMYNYFSSPILENCTFTNNSVDNSGGGMTNNYFSNPTLTNCTFTGNSASSGGGMANFSSSPTLTNCTFTGNTANWGGAMYFNHSSPTLTNCTFTGNTANYNGGGLYNYSDFGPQSNPTLTDCTFTTNTANTGGGMYNDGGWPTLTDTTVCGNTPDQIIGDWTNNGGNTIADVCPWDCHDINGDGYVNVTDLLAVIDQWGLADSPADVNFDGIVDVSDLLMVVGNWGSCE